MITTLAKHAECPQIKGHAAQNAAGFLFQLLFFFSQSIYSFPVYFVWFCIGEAS